jgi:hypothetical protein
MKYIKTFENRVLSKKYIKVGSVLCVGKSEYCKVFTIGKKYDFYDNFATYNHNVYKIYNDLGNYTTIWIKSHNDMKGIFFTDVGTAAFSTIDDSLEDYNMRKDAIKYNL